MAILVEKQSIPITVYVPDVDMTVEQFQLFEAQRGANVAVACMGLMSEIREDVRKKVKLLALKDEKVRLDLTSNTDKIRDAIRHEESLGEEAAVIFQLRVVENREYGETGTLLAEQFPSSPSATSIVSLVRAERHVLTFCQQQQFRAMFDMTTPLPGRGVWPEYPIPLEHNIHTNGQTSRNGQAKRASR